MPIALVAIGGNSLVLSNQIGTIAEQFSNAAITCHHLALLVERGWGLVLTHGNGPQVGNVLLRVEAAAKDVYPLPLDICDADTEGGMGYMLQQVLGNELRKRGLPHTAVTLITQVRVASTDPAFAHPSKPIGPFYDQAGAEAKHAALGWQLVSDAGRGWRRVVPSPRPLEIVELPAIRACLAAGFIPIAVGGGGVPVIEREPGHYVGVEAVIDKDLASALLARQLGVDCLILCTGVERVMLHFGRSDATPIESIDREALRAHLEAGEFPAGSMGPKIQAALAFLEGGGGRVIITCPEQLLDAVEGHAGTHIC